MKHLRWGVVIEVQAIGVVFIVARLYIQSIYELTHSQYMRNDIRKLFYKINHENRKTKKSFASFFNFWEPPRCYLLKSIVYQIYVHKTKLWILKISYEQCGWKSSYLWIGGNTILGFTVNFLKFTWTLSASYSWILNATCDVELPISYT